MLLFPQTSHINPCTVATLILYHLFTASVVLGSCWHTVTTHSLESWGVVSPGWKKKISPRPISQIKISFRPHNYYDLVG